MSDQAAPGAAPDASRPASAARGPAVPEPAEAETRTYPGPERVTEDAMAPFPAAALAAALGEAAPWPAAGRALPAFWHWLHFHEPAAAETIGRDGHLATGGFIPAPGLPRRMWAGSDVDFVAPLTLGRPARRRSRVLSLVHKKGRSGPMALITVEHRIEGAASDGWRHALTERQNLVFLEDRVPGAPGRPPAAAPADETRARRWCMDPPLLFRYSALTWNGHRIHYDADYCREIEGYPGLVVHGPLLATLLLHLAAEHRPDRHRDGFVGAFSFRAEAPVFAGERFETCLREQDDGLMLWVRGSDGRLAMRATLI
ncbi:MAG: hypothetical protein AAF677_03750 [Pseudomonadota bacterium]